MDNIILNKLRENYSPKEILDTFTVKELMKLFTEEEILDFIEEFDGEVIKQIMASLEEVEEENEQSQVKEKIDILDRNASQLMVWCRNKNLISLRQYMNWISNPKSIRKHSYYGNILLKHYPDQYKIGDYSRHYHRKTARKINSYYGIVNVSQNQDQENSQNLEENQADVNFIASESEQEQSYSGKQIQKMKQIKLLKQNKKKLSSKKIIKLEKAENKKQKGRKNNKKIEQKNCKIISKKKKMQICSNDEQKQIKIEIKSNKKKMQIDSEDQQQQRRQKLHAERIESEQQKQQRMNQLFQILQIININNLQDIFSKRVILEYLRDHHLGQFIKYFDFRELNEIVKKKEKKNTPKRLKKNIENENEDQQLEKVEDQGKNNKERERYGYFPQKSSNLLKKNQWKSIFEVNEQDNDFNSNIESEDKAEVDLIEPIQGPGQGLSNEEAKDEDDNYSEEDSLIDDNDEEEQQSEDEIEKFEREEAEKRQKKRKR